jgi:NAD(P)-dependent dehydrogenase (short-subunit alcohol dehydrogenase family)
MEGKTAVVTGSTSGIGLGIAHHLASKGCNVVLTGLADQTVIDDLIKDFKRYIVFNGTRISRLHRQYILRQSTHYYLF